MHPAVRAVGECTELDTGRGTGVGTAQGTGVRIEGGTGTVQGTEEDKHLSRDPAM